MEFRDMKDPDASRPEGFPMCRIGRKFEGLNELGFVLELEVFYNVSWIQGSSGFEEVKSCDISRVT
jgi:hypothetical protein